MIPRRCDALEHPGTVSSARCGRSAFFPRVPPPAEAEGLLGLSLRLRCGRPVDGARALLGLSEGVALRGFAVGSGSWLCWKPKLDATDERGKDDALDTCFAFRTATDERGVDGLTGEDCLDDRDDDLL